MSAPRAKICLITPGHLSTNPRIVKEADALSAEGHEVTVISCRFLEWADKADAEFARRPWRSLRTVSFGPLAHRHVYARQTLKHKITRAALGMVPHNLALAEAACHPACGDLVRAACAVKADLYIAHYTAALPAAAKAAKTHGTKFGFDAEDFHPGDLPDEPQHRQNMQIIRTIESEYLPKVSFMTAASPGIAKAYAQEYRIREPAVVLNVFDPPPAEKPPKQEGEIQRPALYWFSQTIGPGRGLETAIEAIAIARTKPHLYLRGSVRPNYRVELEGLAERHDVLARLHFLEIAPPTELEVQGTVFDAGYVGEMGSPRNREIALTNKIFSYMSSGLAIVMSDIKAHVDLFPEISEFSRLFSVGSSAGLARALDDLLCNKGKLAEAHRVSRQLALTRYNWNLERLTLLAVVNTALATTSRT